jgi:hypothetical protein
MAPRSRTAEREEERRLNMRTLVIASAASATAALITSQLWIAGTWIAAAMTPVIVTLVSEMLHRPTEKIARSLTSDRPALLAEAAGPAPPARPDADKLPDRAPEEPVAGAGHAEPPGAGPPVRVYRSGSSGRPPRTRRRRIANRAVFGTAALAFVIAVLAITVPELVAGGSIGKNDGRTTLFSGSKKKDDGGERREQAPQDTAPEDEEQPEQQQTTPEEQPEQTVPEEETTPTETLPDQTAPPGEPPAQTTPTPPTEQP